MKKTLIMLTLFVLVVVFITSCKKDESPTSPQNRLPKIESLTANPATLLVNTETTLTCIATDEDGDNLTITWSSKRGTFPNGVVGVAIKWVAPATAGIDTISVIVNDGKQTLQKKLEVIVGIIPTSPTLTVPVNSLTGISLSPTLIWTSTNNAISYTLQVSVSSSFTNFVYNQSGLTNTTQQISGLNIATTYYWRVNSSNIYGISSWSNVFSFTTGAPPQTPSLLTPANNSTEIILSPVLVWSAISNAVSYTLQVSTSSLFTSFAYNQSGLTNTSLLINNLYVATTYYWRVNATNSFGTSTWSTGWSFITGVGGSPCVGTTAVTYAGKTYNTVQIGVQCWLKENLDVGNMIQANLNPNPSNNNIIEKYCYDNKTENCDKYGGLYQWNEAMAYSTTPGAKGICPDGWHIPTYAEFEALKNSSVVNTNSNALKVIGQGTGSGSGTNASGFSALLAGFGNGLTSFRYLGNYTYFCSSTEYNSSYVYTMNLDYAGSNISLSDNGKDGGFSVRCLKD